MVKCLTYQLIKLNTKFRNYNKNKSKSPINHEQNLRMKQLKIILQTSFLGGKKRLKITFLPNYFKLSVFRRKSKKMLNIVL